MTATTADNLELLAAPALERPPFADVVPIPGVAAAVHRGAPTEILALLRTPAIKDAISDALVGIKGLGVRAGVDELAKVDLQTLVQTDAEVLLLDVDLGNAADLKSLAELMCMLPQGRSVVVTSGNPTFEGMRSLLRIGIADVVPQPINKADLLRALAAAIERKQKSAVAAAEPAGRVICFMGASGGMGATTLAVQSGCALAAKGGKGDHETAAAACLLDLDLQFGNVAVYLDLSSKSSIIDLERDIARLDGPMLRAAMAHHGCGLDVLAAPERVEPIDALAPESLTELLRIARQEYRDVLVDLPPVWTGWTPAVIRSAHSLVLVLQPFVPAIRQAKRQLEKLIDEGLEAIPTVLLVNRVPAKRLFGSPTTDVTVRDASGALGRDIGYTVPDDPAAVSQAVNHGLPLFGVSGGKATAKRIADNIAGILAGIEAREAGLDARSP